MPRKKPDAAAPAAASPVDAESEIAKLRREKTAAREETRKAKASGKPPSTAEILDRYGLDAILDEIERGKFMPAIAAEIGVPRRTMVDWINRDETRRLAVEAAQLEAGNAYAAKAEAVLTNLPDDPSTGAIAKARELASQYRWMAKMMNRAVYGDQAKVEVVTPASELSDEQLAKEIAAHAAALPGILPNAPDGTRLQ